MATLLEANEVTKIYAKGQRPSLNKVSFNVAESEFIAIMGACQIIQKLKPLIVSMMFLN